MNIEDLKKFLNMSKIKWSVHCFERMQERNISRVDVKNCILNGEIIEDYPNDFPYPSCLIFGYTIKEKVIHVVAGSDGELIMCIYCKCKTMKKSTTTHVVNYNNCIIVIKNVPCEECEQCGEKYYTDEVAEQLERLVNSAKCLMQEISVIDFNKAA